MIEFQISINGKPYCESEAVTVLTMVSEQTHQGRDHRISLHASGDAEGSVQWLAADLKPGDEIIVRVVEATGPASEFLVCSFCGREQNDVAHLVKGPAAAICDRCIADFSGALKHGHVLPVGASIRDEPEWGCGFCGNKPGAVPGVIVRNGAAVCPECLRTCSDILPGERPGPVRTELK